MLSRLPPGRLKAPLATLRSFLHFAHDNIEQPHFLDNLLVFLSFYAPPGSKEPSFFEKGGVVAAFLEDMFGDADLEGLRLRENIARFILVSNFIALTSGDPSF